MVDSVPFWRLGLLCRDLLGFACRALAQGWAGKDVCCY